MTPSAYNNNVQVFQAPDYVVILNEMIHHVRIVPLDDRPQLPQEIRQWMGSSRGRWEGNTLVVDTTNLNAKPRLDVIGDFFSDQAHLLERFIFIDDATMHYEVTITDPTVFTQAWTMRVVQRREAEEEFWEYACHEGERDALHSSRQFLNSDAGNR